MATLTVEVANTPESRAIGLMNRDSLPSDSGMLFLFDVPQVLSFWMKNTSIPLDIAYINEDWCIDSIVELEPFDEQSKASVSDHCVAAIEVNRGWFAKNNIEVGCSVAVDGNTVVFDKDGYGQQDGALKTAAPFRGLSDIDMSRIFEMSYRYPAPFYFTNKMTGEVAACLTRLNVEPDKQEFVGLYRKFKRAVEKAISRMPIVIARHIEKANIFALLVTDESSNSDNSFCESKRQYIFLVVTESDTEELLVDVFAHESWHVFAEGVDFWHKAEGIKELKNQIRFTDQFEDAEIDRRITRRWDRMFSPQSVAAWDEQFADALSNVVTGTDTRTMNETSLRFLMQNGLMSSMTPEDALQHINGDITHNFMSNEILRRYSRFANYEYHFDVWSDIYGPKKVRDDLLTAIQQDEGRALVVCVGDYNEKPSDDKLKEIRKLFDGHFGQDGWVSTPGNHETRWIDDKQHDLDWYENRIGPANDVRVVNNDTFIMFNTAFKRVLYPDWMWLETQLAEATHRGGRIFVATHVPCIDSVTVAENEEDHGLPDQDASLFMRLMEDYEVTAVFSSHQHGYETWFRNGVIYVGVAAGGSPLDEKDEGYGYVQVFVGEIVRIERISLYPPAPKE